ncbi:hypothetical protein PR048_004477 [Dryococelus australis]|uniref:Uncharacterized protein n=1 Tax=Dryococelus australis TaxID=614101 RepID=A0ABQ9I5J1_9NEOP|nr:hypothetical protein PR048_004477 [Dryococelus australis]
MASGERMPEYIATARQNSSESYETVVIFVYSSFPIFNKSALPYINENGERGKVCIITSSYEIEDKYEYFKRELGPNVVVKLHGNSNTLHSEMSITARIDFI